MGPIISVHSYRRGTGKSFVAANLAAILAGRGQRVGIVDSNSQFPSLHYMFRLHAEEIKHSLFDYIFGKCDILDAVIEVGGRFDAKVKDRVFLIPCNEGEREAFRTPHESYDIERLFNGLNRFIKSHELDLLLVDASAGLNDDSLPYIAGSNILIEIMRPDRQDLSGTATVIFTAQKLDVPKTFLVMNQIPQAFDLDEIRIQLENAYDCPIAALMHYSEEVAYNGSSGIFSAQYPDHSMTHEIQRIADHITMLPHGRR